MRQWYSDAYTNGFNMGYEKDKKEAQSERKKGEWIEDKTGYGFWICSACGFVSEAFGADILYHYCPAVGADMRSGDELSKSN